MSTVAQKDQELYLHDIVDSVYKRNGYETLPGTCTVKKTDGKYVVIINTQSPKISNYFFIHREVKENFKELGYEIVGDSFFYENNTITLK